MNWNKMLDGKVALITGAGSGTGRATAHVFAEHGARVVAADVNGETAADTAANIVSGGGGATATQTDVGKMGDVERMVRAAEEKYGRLDVVSSNVAGYKLGTATDLSEADWDCTLDVCLKATYMIAHHAMPLMLRQPAGSFIITGSVHSIRGYARHTAYQASKGGLLALTRALAADYAPQNSF